MTAYCERVPPQTIVIPTFLLMSDEMSRLKTCMKILTLILHNVFVRRYRYRLTGCVVLWCLSMTALVIFHNQNSISLKPDLVKTGLRMFGFRESFKNLDATEVDSANSFGLTEGLNTTNSSNPMRSIQLQPKEVTKQVNGREAKGPSGNDCGGYSKIPTRPQEDLKETFEWQRLMKESSNTFVFSAHYEPRGEQPAIVVVGISSEYNSYPISQVFCQVWIISSDNVHVSRADVQFHSETHGRRYAATFYTCSIPRGGNLPYAVSLIPSSDKCETADNLLKVTNHAGFTDSEVNFTVCVTPLNYNYDNYRHLVEMVELNRMFGAQRIVFYNLTTGSRIIPYLNSYAEEGIIDVIPWKLPVITDGNIEKMEPEIHYFGQLAALNDCLYRNLLRSQYVVFTDLDEIVIPRQHNNWIEMIVDFMKGHSPNDDTTASFHFRNAFFRIDLDFDSRFSSDETVRSLGLQSLLTTSREARIYPHGWRSKHIVKPTAVRLVGIHHIERFNNNEKSSVLNVPEEVALLHHYRSWKGEEVNPPTTVTDRYIHRFNFSIISQTLSIHRNVVKRYENVSQFDEEIINLVTKTVVNF